MLKADVLLDGIRILFRSLKRTPLKTFEGNAEEICRQVIEACWNGTYFKAGAGHLDQFWIRDLGWCADDLVSLGYGDKVVRSLEWALEIYKTHGAVTTTIFRMRTPADIFTFASDSLPFLLCTCRVADAVHLVEERRDFLQKMVEQYVEKVVDRRTKMVRKERYFSTCKDVMRYRSSCTSNCFLYLLRKEIREYPFLNDPLGGGEDGLAALANDIVGRYWVGDHFKNDDISPVPFISADANVWPFWCGVVADLERLKTVVQAVGRVGLDNPFPIKYHTSLDLKSVHPLARLLIPNYQGDSIWTLLGPLWIRLVGKVNRDKAVEQLAVYTRLIENHRTYLEVFEPDGSGPLRGRLGHGSDGGMLWASMYLGLVRDLHSREGSEE